MNNYGELNPEAEKRIHLAFKDKHEHILKVNMHNMAFPGLHIVIEFPHGSSDHVIVTCTVKISFNLDIKSKDKTRNVVNNVGRALVKKLVLMLGLKGIDTINNSDMCDSYKDLFLSEKNVKKNYFKEYRGKRLI